VYGIPVNVFEDDCNNLANWNAGNWGISTSQYHSPTGSITDSPFGNYQNNINKSITLQEPVDLTLAAYAVLNFWGKWAIEPGWDYVQVKASSDGGLTWTPLSGKYTITGNENQLPGQPLYDGFQDSWIQEEMDLGNFLGDSILIRFTLVSDSYTTYDGFYFDDLSITIIDVSTGIGETILPEYIILSNPVPNPAGSIVRVNYALPYLLDDTRLVIYNALGQRSADILMKDKSGSVVFNVDGWRPGLYYYNIAGSFGNSPAKKLIIQ
jgi:hypothetical protein